MSKLRALGRSLHDPAVTHAFLAAMTVLGAWTVLEGLVAQAQQAGRELAAVQAQAQATVRRARAAAAAAQAAAQANSAGTYSYDRLKQQFYSEGPLDQDDAPAAAAAAREFDARHAGEASSAGDVVPDRLGEPVDPISHEGGPR